MSQSVRRVLLIAVSLLALPASAHAHLTGTGLGPFYDGVTHFFLSPEQIIPVLALGLFAGLRGKRSGRIALFLLPAAWLVGGLVGLSRPVTGQFTLLTCFSFLVLGALVAADAKLQPRYVAGLALGFGLALGYVNGSDLSTTNIGALGILGTATSIFVLVALVAALVASLHVPWTRIVVRVAGSWIAAAGLLLIGWVVHTSNLNHSTRSSAVPQRPVSLALAGTTVGGSFLNQRDVLSRVGLAMQRVENPLLQNGSKLRLYFAKHQTHARVLDVQNSCLSLEKFS